LTQIARILERLCDWTSQEVSALLVSSTLFTFSERLTQ